MFIGAKTQSHPKFPLPREWINYGIVWRWNILQLWNGWDTCNNIYEAMKFIFKVIIVLLRYNLLTVKYTDFKSLADEFLYMYTFV